MHFCEITHPPTLMGYMQLHLIPSPQLIFLVLFMEIGKLKKKIRWFGGYFITLFNLVRNFARKLLLLFTNQFSSITSTETINPYISGTPEHIDQSTDSNSPTAKVTWTPPTASDNSGVVELSTNHDTGSTFPIGSTTVTYTATDPSLNQVTSSFIITITGKLLFP